MVRKLKEEQGLRNRDPAVSVAVAELKRLKALAAGSVPSTGEVSAAAAAAEEVRAEGDDDWATFHSVQKNRDACINWLLTYGQTIEREWWASARRRPRPPRLPPRLKSLTGVRCALHPPPPHE